jgi:hypothetical protein
MPVPGKLGNCTTTCECACPSDLIVTELDPVSQCDW